MAIDEDAIGFDEPATKTLGLCMIVKDEAAVIERCLDSVRPLIDYVLIEDTGSTDGTQELIRAYLRRHGIAGEVIEEKWRDFAYNRSHAMARLREKLSVDYALIMDADDRLVIDPGFDAAGFKAGLWADLYHVWIRLGSTRYHRPQICSNRLGFYFRGIVHEFLEGPPTGHSSETAEGFYVAAGVEGARSNDPDKYRKDAQALERALAAETDAFMRTRYTFYLAQSWRDCGENAKSVAAYLERAGQGGWNEEVFISLCNAGKLQEALGEPIETVVATLQRATDLVPHRNEARHAATRACRFAGRNELGCDIARSGLDLSEPATGLFIEPWVYRYGLLDEFAINAFWAGQHREALDACERLLRIDAMPSGERARVLQNAEFAYQRMAPVGAEPTIQSQGPAGTGLAQHLRRAFDRAMAREARFDATLPGFEGPPDASDRLDTGRKFRMLVNRLIAEIDDARYLEIGSAAGSTLCTAVSGNAISATAIGDWPAGGEAAQLFMRNAGRFLGTGARLTTLESDFRAVDYDGLGKSNVFLYAGPHDERDHHDSIDLVLPALGESFVLIVGDWNWDQVRRGTLDAIGENGLSVDLKIEVRTTPDGTTPQFRGGDTDWHNGYLFAVLTGNRRGATTARPAPAAAPVVRGAVPRVLLAILAKQKEAVLPFYLMCIEALDYPKDSIVLYVRTNNSTDRTRDILADWVDRIGPQYAQVEFDTSDVAEPVQDFAVHEWNALRVKVLGRLRQESLLFTLKAGCTFYFVADVDNFVRPHVLREMVAANQPVVGPLLRYVDRESAYSNYHAKVDSDGYFAASDEDAWFLEQRVKGLCQVDVIHSTYLVRADMIRRLYYDDGSGRHEYVIFSDSARRNDVPQYLDTREVYGYLTLDENPEPAIRLLGPTVGLRLLQQRRQGDAWQIAFCCGLPSSGSTWLFNLVREITLAAGWPFLSQYAGAETDFLLTLSRGVRLIVKTHAPTPATRTFIAASREPVTLTVRDPRDAAVSLMRRFGENFDSALAYIASDAEHLVALAKTRPVQVWRYEDGFTGAETTFDRVAELLGARLSAEQRASILRKLSPDEVRRTIDQLAAADQLPGGVDLATHWHLNHVGDGRVGKYVDVLTQDQQTAIVERTREFCVHFGYGVTPEPAETRDKTFASCPVCGATETTKPRPELEPHPYHCCSGCGLFYQPYMQTKVFEGHHEARGDTMSEADRAGNLALARALYHNHLAPKFGEEPLLHLDIGAKYPFFGHCLQKIAQDAGRSLLSHGIDGIAEAHEFGRQLGVLMAVGDFEADPLSWDMPEAMRERIVDGGFHCISLIHCLEHFYDPLRALRQVRRLMRPGGVLFIRSPDSQAPEIEGDFTDGHYSIHPTIWCERVMRAALAGIGDIFALDQHYQLLQQRDYLLRAVDPEPAAKTAPPGARARASIREAEPRSINILRPGAIGDILASGAVTAQLAGRFLGVPVRYYTKIPEMAQLLIGVDQVFDADEWDRREPGRDLWLTGYPLAEGYPERPMQKHLVAYFCDEAGVPFGKPRLKEPEPFAIDRPSWVTIHPKAGWSVYKEWPLDNWNAVVARFREAYPDIAIAQIGGAGDPTIEGADCDLRGGTSISQAIWLVKNSVLHLGVDSFTNHAAGAFEHPAVIVFGSTSPTGSGYDTAINLWAGLGCSPCYREDPAISRQSRGPCINPPGQEYAEPRHACMASITVDQVWQAIADLIPRPSGAGPVAAEPKKPRQSPFKPSSLRKAPMSDSDPVWIEPMNDYLGFVCENCGRKFAVTKALDPIEFPTDKRIRIGATGGRVPADCTHCGHLGDYPIDKLIRFSR